MRESKGGRVFVPIQDDNPLRHIRFQIVTAGLIIINVAVYLLEAFSLDQARIASFALVPSELFHLVPAGDFGHRAHEAPVIPERLTLLSYMFFHLDIFHLFGNMIFLWVFGDNVEDAMGHLRFLLFYLACGVLAGLTHAFLQPGSPVPLIGASGAVAGVIAAYLVLHPRVRMWVLAFKVIPLRITAMWALGAWIAMQLVMVALTMNRPEPIAWWAHIGGLVAGALLVLVLRRPGVPLLDKGLAKAV